MSTEIKNIVDWYTNSFKGFEESLNGQASNSVHVTRRYALERFEELRFPGKKNEEWKYTSIADILKYNFINSSAKHNTVNKINFELLDLINKLEANLLVFVNGYYSKELSRIDINDNIKIESFDTAIKKYPEIIEKHFAKYAVIENGFNALNTAFAVYGAFIYVTKGSVIEKPVYLLYLNGNDSDNIVNYPRNLFIAEENSQVSIIENYIGISTKTYFTNAVTEVFAGENSVLNIYKLQQEDLNAYHISKTQALLAKNSNFVHTLISVGGALVRNDLNSVLNGEGVTAEYNGLYMTSGTQHVDNHTLADHSMPNCLSNETYKGILGGSSRGVFNGKIVVRPDAQKTNAYQSNKNIILTKEALMNTKPQLEIFADDVRCTHGATIGQLEESQIFYLRSRGIDEITAKNLLIHAFADDVIDMIKLEPLREYTSKYISDYLDKFIKHE